MPNKSLDIDSVLQKKAADRRKVSGHMMTKAFGSSGRGATLIAMMTITATVWIVATFQSGDSSFGGSYWLKLGGVMLFVIAMLLVVMWMIGDSYRDHNKP